MSASQSTVVRDIAPFNPPGTHPPGSLPAHLFPTGSAPVNPSYPIRPPDTVNQEQHQEQQPPAPAYYPGPSPQMAVEVSLQLDPAYQKLYKGESFMLATPNPLPLHNEMIQDKLELFGGLEEEAQDQEVKAAIRAAAVRFTAELEASRRNAGPRFRPTTTVIRLLLIAAAEAKSEAANGILRSLAEQYRDSQVESIEDDSIFQVEDPVESQRVSQKVAIYESLMEKHPDAIALCGACIQNQFSTLTDMDKKWQDDAASPLIRAIAEMYREVAIKSLNTRVTPISTMLQVMAHVEAQQTDPIAKVRVALMAKMYRGQQETALEFAQSFKQPPYDRADGQVLPSLRPAATSPVTPLPPAAITAQPRHAPLAVGTDPQTPIHPLSPSWSTNNSTIYDSASSQYGRPLDPSTPQLSSMHNTMHGQPLGHLQPQASMNTLQMPMSPGKEDPVPPYPGGPVPLLSRQPKICYGEGGMIKSKDQMLNTDGDALYRFLLDNLNPPTFQLHCYGSHTVTDVVANGKEVRTKQRTIVDFDFIIDLSLSMQDGPGAMYVLDDSNFAYRGAMTKEVGKSEMPQSVQAWSRDYAASLKTGKEFRFRKAVVGLDRNRTLDAVNQIINSTGHSTYRKVYFTVTRSTIQVRADSALMTMLKDSFISCLLWLVCVFPIVWLIRRFGSNGGKWDTCRAEFVCDKDPRDPDNVHGVPLGDGDWVKVWERTLRLAVSNRIKTTSPIYRPTANDSGVILFD